ncbi:hypothetical protein NIES4073_44090 [Kalymmatonema gypsitolerans NIES-4073]|nr:hypothetical protein NIES4073_44090 [Scytonema sp. NIES-4073]
MHGNVWECCADHWHSNYEGAPTDGSAWLDDVDNDYHMLQGGSWYDDPENCRSAFRLINLRAERDDFFNFIGFRVVCAFGRTQ